MLGEVGEGGVERRHKALAMRLEVKRGMGRVAAAECCFQVRCLEMWMMVVGSKATWIEAPPPSLSLSAA